MRNPNTTTLNTFNTSTDFIMVYAYTSASVCKHDFPSMQDTYAHGKVEMTTPKSIKVTIPLYKEG
jgi:hypothetical protein